ncbi:heterokaryon incompatibility protein-domain-containing protein [Chaetomium strumarium]|uniref:Heterokaryon incompatibility protein-domain-containing protein n=1 Tax=Chaetomium strumarium TaxID=1170767 RepID=A0AAJ0GZ05_9PEZI|nr:heterokaryon incompatibility protein-domain-containing protein [Chaetomium strumarium]
MTDTSYRYLPLRPHLKEIRLLTLFPASADTAAPRCSLATHTLGDPLIPSYSALSYVWGNPATTSGNPHNHNVIHLDGHPFAVTANLLSALRHLRPPATGTSSTSTQSIVLWVDAVCINQSDLDERSQQVAMMRDIYAGAGEVIIWLGEDEEGEAGAVFGIIQELEELNRHPRVKDRDDEEVKQTRLQLMRKCASFLFGLAEARPWFSRVWILQELAMARNDPWVMCGWKRVRWSALVNTWKAIAKEVFTEMGMVRRKERDGEYQNSSSEAGDNTKALKETPDSNDDDGTEVLGKLKLDLLDDLRSTRCSEGGVALRKLLLISRTSQSTDPRDRVYGLLGLLSPDDISSPSTIPIPVDYRKPTWEVFADAMSHLFSRGEGPYFLSGVFLPGPEHTSPASDWPSWVPDFSRQTAETAAQPSGIQFHPPAETGGASGAGANCINGRRLPDKRTLRIEGLIVGVVNEVVPFGKSLMDVIQQLPLLESLVLSAKQRPCHIQGCDPSIAPFVERFRNQEPLWRILISNKRYMSGYNIAPASYEELYLGLLNHGPSRLDMESDPGLQELDAYERCLRDGAAGKRAFFTTKNGFVGTCVPSARAGDLVALWFGSPVPFVLRPATTTTERQTYYYLLVGAAYVGGIMGGEMVDELYCEDLMDSVAFYVQ